MTFLIATVAVFAFLYACVATETDRDSGRQIALLTILIVGSLLISLWSGTPPYP